MQDHHTILPAMSAATLARLVEILTPYHGERLTAATVALAYRLATLEAAR